VKKFLTNMRMRLFVSLTAILLLSLAACHPKGGSDARTSERAQGPAAAPTDGVRRVTVAELNEALEKGEAIAVDVRGGVDYDLGHIKGARSVPLGLVAERAKELPRDKLIVAYCA
jgi:3-mercaptopyruvate sulfurtransferase SseA